MSTTPIATAAATSGSSGAAAPENPNGMLGKDDFLKLMIAQLQAQNPLEPSNGTEYVAELAQFTQLEQTTNLAGSSERSEAVQLIGHTVTYTNSSGTLVTGKVQSVQTGSSSSTLTVEGVDGVELPSVVEVS